MLEIPTRREVFRGNFSPSEILRVGRIMDAANRRQQLHAKLLCVLCKLISQETRINPAVLARRLKVDQHAVNELRPFHPEIFKLIARYEKLRGLWAKGRLSSGRRPGNKKRRIDPLLTRPLSLEA